MTHQVWNQEASEYTGRLVGVGAPSRTSQAPEPVATSRPSPGKRACASDRCLTRSERQKLGVDRGADPSREATAEDRQRALRTTVEPEPLHDRR